MHIEKRIPYIGSTFYGYISGNLEFSCYYHYHYHYQYNIVVFYIISSFKFNFNFQTHMYMHCPEQFPQSPSDEIIDEPRPRDQTKPDHSADLCADHSPHILTAKPDQLQSVGPPDQTNVSLSDQQTRPDETTFPQSTNQLDIFTARPASRQTADEPLFIQVRSIHYGLGQGRLIHKALVGPCKAYYPHTFGLKSPDFYFRL